MSLQNSALQTAVQIGEQIGNSAIWHEGRCNWIGAFPVEQLSPNVRPEVIYQALGPEMYSGTSGVALFLAELFAATGLHPMRSTAMGAMRQAISRMHAIGRSGRLGLFSGWAGIALAAIRIAVLLDEPALLADARLTLERLGDEECSSGEFDLISGRAGAIAALLATGGLLGESSILELAAKFGDELIEQADSNGSVCSWSSPSLRYRRNLTGFSHGTAGAAYALLELFLVTGKSAYRNAALAAFDYERGCFDSKLGNWPDFRATSSLGRRGKQPAIFVTFWCHGAPGIGLSRLRACEILQHGELSSNSRTTSQAGCALKREAVAAVETTCASLKSALAACSGNFSLCHGLAGNAELLVYACETVGLPEKDKDLLRSVAEYGVENYGRTQRPWPCGTHGGQTPGLMLGLSGIGHFYLRLAQPAVPSVLLLRRTQWAKQNREMSATTAAVA